jgi:hypothetical protein
MTISINIRDLYEAGMTRPAALALTKAVSITSIVEGGSVPGQTAAEIKVAYESNADTNAYTDAEKTLLAQFDETLLWMGL